MSDGFQAPRSLPPKTPGRKLYSVLFAIIAFIVLIATGFDKAKTLPTNIIETCREFHICGPKPLSDLPDLQTEYGDGIGAIAAAQPTLERYQAANPDYIITFHNDPKREHGSCDNALIKIECKYSYGGTFTGEPKWTGKLKWVAAGVSLLVLVGLMVWSLRRYARNVPKAK